MKIPELGQTVFVVYHGACIIQETVYALAKESFIVSGFGPDVRSDSWEWRYDDFETTWFTDFGAARDKLFELSLREYPEDNLEIVELSKKYWEVKHS